MSDIRVTGAGVERGAEVLTEEALEFVADLHRTFAARRDELLTARTERRRHAAASGGLDFLQETRAIREDRWQVAPVPDDLRDRRVEITGPTERKMTINAMNSGAKVWLADLEDANTPHWTNVVSGQVNLCDAVRETVELTSPDGKRYALRTDRKRPVIVMRPRGWHYDERHVLVDEQPVVAALLDFGLYLFHNARELIRRGSGPYFYLPKLESHLEARLWNEVFTQAERSLGLEHGTIRATVLIETIPAAFEMEEILYELRDHCCGLNAGRWDYLFSIIKYFRDAGPSFVLPDRNTIGMTTPFMRAYTELLVRTCHRRGAFAIGGMAAFIPSRRDPEVTERALANVHEDKRREAADGFDGSWVAHPDLVEVCREEFDKVLGERPNQVDRLREDARISASELLDIGSATGSATEDGLASAVDVGVRYIASWLGGNGAAAIHNLMEDAATAEISRSQLWQWVHGGVVLDSGREVTGAVVREQLVATRAELVEAFDAQLLDTACELFEQVALADEFPDFLTLPAYRSID